MLFQLGVLSIQGWFCVLGALAEGKINRYTDIWSRRTFTVAQGTKGVKK